MKIARVFPRKLSEFTGAQTTKDGFEPRLLDRAPQSWRYVVGWPE
jgi:hypothetical protein